MDAVLLARIQTGLAIGFHYLFPIATLGLTLFILIFETLHLRTKKPECAVLSRFLVRLLSPIFVMGVATGLLLPFTFGANWAGFSRFGGNIFGLPLAIEGITAFSIESVTIAILLYGRGKVRPGAYWFAAFMIFFATHMSGFWIVSANSWMQTPAGCELVNGRLVLTDFWAALFSPSCINRYFHVIAGSWIAGSTIILSLGAYYWARQRRSDAARVLLRFGSVALLVTGLMEVGIGHAHIMDTVHNQPGKAAAFEGVFKTGRNVPLYLFGIPDAEHQKILFGIGMPGGLSFLETFDFNGEVKGLDQVSAEYMPPVNVIFTTFHIMVGIGILLIGAGILCTVLMVLGKLEGATPLLRALPLLTPLPFIANEAGWMGAEIGRQPWVIYGLQKTAEATSTAVPADQIAATVVILSLCYAAFLTLFLVVARRIVRSGPEAV